MHHAPSVTYPVGRSSTGAAVMSSVWVAGLAVTLAWLAAAPGWRPLAGAGVVAVLGAWAGLAWRASPRGELGWDGTGWSWSSPRGASAVRVAVALDLQRALLVRLGPGGAPHAGEAVAAAPPPHWLWLEAAAMPGRWSALRRAVYSRADPEVPPADGPSAATP